MPLVHESATLHLTLRGVDLTNVQKGWFGGTSSPTFKVCAFSPGKAEMWQTVKTSERIDQNLDPLWPAVQISCQELCGCDLDRPIQITVFDQDKAGADVGSMGAFETSVSAILKRKIEDLNNVDVSKLYTLEEKGKQVGKIVVMNAWVEEPAAEKLKRAMGNVKLLNQVTGTLAALSADADSDSDMDGPYLEFKLRGINLEPVPKGLLRSNTNPLFKLSRLVMGQVPPFEVVFTSEVINDEVNPKWKLAKVSTEKLGDRDLPLTISVYDKEGDKETLIGECEASVSDLLRNRVGDTDNVDVAKIFKLRGGGKDKGMLVAVEALIKSSEGSPTASKAMPSTPPHAQAGSKRKDEPATKPPHRKDDHHSSTRPNSSRDYKRASSRSDDDKSDDESLRDDKHGPTSASKASSRDNKRSPSRSDDDKTDDEKPKGGKHGYKRPTSRSDDDKTDDDKPKDDKHTIPKTLNNTSMLHLTLEGVDMANVEGWFGCSDPFFQVEAAMKGFDGTAMWQSIHRSEHIDDNLNPKWEPVEINLDLLCQLDLDKAIRVKLFDWEESGKHNPMGSFETTVSKLLQARAEKKGDSWDLSKAFIPKSDDGEEFGNIVVVDAYIDTPSKSRKYKGSTPASIIVDEDSMLRLTLEGVDMANVEGWFGCSDPFFQVETPMKGPDGTIIWQHVHRSEYIQDTLNPQWKPAEMSVDLLCQLDLDKPIRISFFDWEESGKHNPMGHFETSVNRLVRSKAEKKGDSWDLSKAFITKSEDGEEFGKIVVVDVSIDLMSSGKRSKSKKDVHSKSGTTTEVKVDKDSALVLTLAGVDMANVEGWFGCSDPFFQIEAPVHDSTSSTKWQKIFESEHIDDNLNPRWEPATLALESLCELDLDKPIRISFFDWEENNQHNPMGFFVTSVNRLLRSKAPKNGESWDLAKAFITKSEDGQEFGKIIVVDVLIDPKGARKAAGTNVVKSDPVVQKEPPATKKEYIAEEKPVEATTKGSATESSNETKEPKSKAPQRSLSPTPKREQPTLEDVSFLSLTLEGVDLANVEGWFGCSDPFFHVSIPMISPSGLITDWISIHKSEHLDDTLNPTWKSASIDLALLGGGEIDLDKNVRVSVFDWEEGGQHNPMGHFDCTVQELLDASCNGKRQEQSKAFMLMEAGEIFGKIYILDAKTEGRKRKPNATVSEDSVLNLELEGVEMANVEGWLGCSDPLYKIEALSSDSSWQTVYTSEHIDDTLNPKWNPAQIKLGGLDLNKIIKISVFDWEESGEHRPMGSVVTSINGLLDAVTEKRGDQWDTSKAFITEKDGKVFGKLVVASATIESTDAEPEAAHEVPRSPERTVVDSLRSYSPGRRGSYSGHSRRSRSSHSRSRSHFSNSSSHSRSRHSDDESAYSKRSYDSRLSREGSARSLRSGDSYSKYSERSRSSRSGSPLSESRSRYSDEESFSKRSYDSRVSREGSVLSSRSIQSGKSRSHHSSDKSRSLRSSHSLHSNHSDQQSKTSSKHSQQSDLSGEAPPTDNHSDAEQSARSERSGRSSLGSELSDYGSKVSDVDKSQRSDGLGSQQSKGSRSYSSRRSGGSEYSKQSRGSDHSGRSRSSVRSYGSPSRSSSGSRSRSRSYSPGSRSYSSRSRRSSWSGSYRSGSYSRRSYSSRSRSYSSRSYSRRSYSSRSRGSYSKSDGSYSRQSGEADGDDGALKLSAWEALQSQAAVQEEEMQDLKFYVTLRGLKLANIKGWFGKTAPFFQISYYSVGTSQPWQPVYTSESIEGDLNPQWKPASISLSLLCDGDRDKKIRVSVLDQNDKTGKSTPMGSFETTVNKLIDAKIGGFGSGDNFEDSKTISLMQDGKEMGRIAVLSAHADVPKERPVVLPETPKPVEKMHSGSSYSSYSRRSSRSYSSRSRSRSSRSRSSRGASRLSASRKSYESRSEFSDDSRSRRSSLSKSERSKSSSESSEESDEEEEEGDPNGLSEEATLHLSLVGVNLQNVEGFFGTSDPFIQIAAYMGMPGALMWQAIFRSEHVDDSLNPRWKPMELNLDLLCKRDLDQPIQISVFDYEENMKHQPMGSFETTVKGLIEAKVFVDDNLKEEVNTSKAFTVMHNGEVYGQIVVSNATIVNPETPKIPHAGGFGRPSMGSTASGKGRKGRKGRKHKIQHQVKFNTHGDELSIGTIESDAEERVLDEPRNVFGEENEDDAKSRPWKEALPSNSGLDNFEDGIGDFALGAGARKDDGSEEGSITNIAEILARVEEAEDSDSEESEGSEDSDEEEKDGSDNEEDEDEEKDDTEQEDENDAMLEMMSSMQQSLSYLAAAPGGTVDDIEVDLEKFDEMYDTVEVDQKDVAEFEKKLEERARRGKKKDGDENEDPDLLRDTPRLILFESEKEKKKRGRKKKKGGTKFSKEFIEAMRQVFGDSDESEESEQDEEEKKEIEAAILRNVHAINKRGSESSLFVGDLHDGDKEEKTERGDELAGDDDSHGRRSRDGDGMDKSRKSVASVPSSAKKPARKRKKPRIDPAQIFEAEKRRLEGSKILTTSGLKQEMADMKKGLTRKMMERELANLRKATTSKSGFSPFDNKQKQTGGLFEDYNATTKSYGTGSSASKTTKPKPANSGGLTSLLSKNDDLKDDNKLDDLATVALGGDRGGGGSQLPQLANITSLNALPISSSQQNKTNANKDPTKKKAKTTTLGAISENAPPLGGGGAGEQTFFATQSAWDDDESQANVGLTNNANNNKGGDAGANAGGLAKGQGKGKFKTPKFGFGKKKGGGGVQLDDDDGGY